MSAAQVAPSHQQPSEKQLSLPQPASLTSKPSDASSSSSIAMFSGSDMDSSLDDEKSDSEATRLKNTPLVSNRTGTMMRMQQQSSNGSPSETVEEEPESTQQSYSNRREQPLLSRNRQQSLESTSSFHDDDGGGGGGEDDTMDQLNASLLESSFSAATMRPLASASSHPSHPARSSNGSVAIPRMAPVNRRSDPITLGKAPAIIPSTSASSVSTTPSILTSTESSVASSAAPTPVATSNESNTTPVLEPQPSKDIAPQSNLNSEVRRRVSVEVRPTSASSTVAPSSVSASASSSRRASTDSTFVPPHPISTDNKRAGTTNINSSVMPPRTPTKQERESRNNATRTNSSNGSHNGNGTSNTNPLSLHVPPRPQRSSSGTPISPSSSITPNSAPTRARKGSSGNGSANAVPYSITLDGFSGQLPLLRSNSTPEGSQSNSRRASGALAPQRITSPQSSSSPVTPVDKSAASPSHSRPSSSPPPSLLNVVSTTPTRGAMNSTRRKRTISFAEGSELVKHMDHTHIKHRPQHRSGVRPIMKNPHLHPKRGAAATSDSNAASSSPTVSPYLTHPQYHPARRLNAHLISVAYASHCVAKLHHGSLLYKFNSSGKPQERFFYLKETVHEYLLAWETSVRSGKKKQEQDKKEYEKEVEWMKKNEKNFEYIDDVIIATAPSAIAANAPPSVVAASARKPMFKIGTWKFNPVRERPLVDAISIHFGPWWSNGFRTLLQEMNTADIASSLCTTAQLSFQCLEKVRKPWYCFTIQFRDRCIDCYCPPAPTSASSSSSSSASAVAATSSPDISDWFHGLQAVIPQSVYHLTRGRFLWQKLIMIWNFYGSAIVKAKVFAADPNHYLLRMARLPYGHVAASAASPQQVSMMHHSNSESSASPSQPVRMPSSSSLLSTNTPQRTISRRPSAAHEAQSPLVSNSRTIAIDGGHLAKKRNSNSSPATPAPIKQEIPDRYDDGDDDDD